MSSTDSTTVLSPGSIPAEFQDHLADELLLAPDAQYLLARFAYSAAMARQFGDLGSIADLALMQFKEGRMGPHGLASNMDQAMAAGMGGPLVLSQMNYPDLIKIAMAPDQAQDGQVVKMNRPNYLSGTKTESTRTLSVNDQVFGGGSQTPTMSQVPVMIREYFGPTDSGGNKAPLNLAQFTRNRTYHDMLKYVGLLMRQDRYSLVDSILHNRLIDAANAQSYVTYSGGLTATSSYTAQGAEPMSYDMIVRSVETMKGPGRFAPGVEAGGKYIAILDLHQIADLKLDPQFQRLSVFQPEFNPLFPGYFRTVENVIVCEDNNMPRLTGQGVNSNLTVYQGLILAPGVLGWACALDAEPLRDRNDDGGRFDRYAWHAFEGWQVLDDRFVQLIVSD